jgi:3-oxoacyl-[acyl-carrier-protein] synthase II
MERRVVVTGLAVRCSLGASADEVWGAVRGLRSGAVRREIPGLGPMTVFPVEDPDADAVFGRRQARRMDRVGALAAVTASEALASAGPLQLPAERVGLAMGSAHGGVTTLETAFETATERGFDRISPIALPLWLPNSAASAAARACELRGPSTAIATACAAGSDAIGFAAAAIRSGRADAMVAGGAEAAATPLTLAGYDRLGALGGADRAPTEASRPFDAARDGFVMGEGAGLLVLEERERALGRGANVIAELSGYGSSCDAGHITDPDPEGAGPARAMTAALAEAGRAPDEVDYVNAHATSTPTGDLAEARALVAAGVGGALVSASKSQIGHTLGAAGGIEAALCVLALRDGVAPATLNLADPEPDPRLRHLTAPTDAELRVAMSTSFGFGGHNAALVLEAAQDS